MVPLLGALLEYDSDPGTYARYDKMTARELFRQYGGLFCVPTVCKLKPHSAAALIGAVAGTTGEFVKAPFDMFEGALTLAT